MERLTKRIEDGMTWFIDREFERGGIKTTINREPCEMDSHHVGVALRRLGEYEDAEEKMLERINREIKFAVSEFTEWNEVHQYRMKKIEGMVDMLSLVTGKDYIITDSGLAEKE